MASCCGQKTFSDVKTIGVRISPELLSFFFRTTVNYSAMIIFHKRPKEFCYRRWMWCKTARDAFYRVQKKTSCQRYCTEHIIYSHHLSVSGVTHAMPGGYVRSQVSIYNNLLFNNLLFLWLTIVTMFNPFMPSVTLWLRSPMEIEFRTRIPCWSVR